MLSPSVGMWRTRRIRLSRGLGLKVSWGGLGGMIRAYGKNSKRLQGHVPGLKLDDPWQKQARVIREELPKVAPKHKPFVEGRMDELSRLIRAEKPAAGKWLCGELGSWRNGQKAGADAGASSRWTTTQ